MMQKVGSRAVGTSNEKAADNASVATPGKPLRLVYCDERGKFKMDAEAVAALQLVKGPIGVVSVCGRARQGKSFILNQLLGRSGGFQVASTHRPCTKGLWMWSTPLKRIAPDGTEYSLLLLDSEGIDAYDQTGTYSTQVFSLAILLSSMFVYNQMGGIDEAALDRLSLVTEITKHIRVRASQNRTSTVELGQFSPIFLWLLRDFYLELTEDGRRIAPRDYLESALQPMQGRGKAIAARNEIRDSIHALFPDRDCFTLVRPLNDEHDLQRLDQIPLGKLRPEFRADLDALTKFVFERTRPKQMGSIVMTGPLLAGLTQSFLDAINAGAVPTIATSWQNVEENACRQAYDKAIELYMRVFDKSAPADESILQEAYDDAVQDALGIYNNEAVGAGAARHKYEKLLMTALKKQFKEYKHRVSMEAELKCVKAVESMDEKLRAACHSPSATLDQVLQELNSFASEYEQCTFGPTKWKKLVKFFQQSLEGPLSDLTKKRNNQSAADNSDLELKCGSLEDKLVLLGKQLVAAQSDAQDWKRRYEATLSDHKTSLEESTSRYIVLQSKYNTLEERCSVFSHQLEGTRKDASDWRRKYECAVSERRSEEDRSHSEVATLQSKCAAAEARLAASREQAESAKEEAIEWRRKYDVAVKNSGTAIEKATAMHERANKHAQRREDALRVEFASTMALKERELKDAFSKLEQSEYQIAGLNTHVKDQELKLKVQENELVALRLELQHLQAVSGNAKVISQSAGRELEIIKQEKTHVEERLSTELRRFEETERKCRVAEMDAKQGTEIAENARDAAAVAQKEKLEAQKLAVERLATIERSERHIEALIREKEELCQEVDRLRFSEEEAVSRAASLGKRLEDRGEEMEELLQSTHEQRANSTLVLESLITFERQARSEANARAEALSLQLQATQGKLDSLQQELTRIRLNEASLDTKLKTLQSEQAAVVGTSCSKKQRGNDYVHVESVQDIEIGSQKKRARVTGVDNGNSPASVPGEGDSSVRHNENGSTDSKEMQDHRKFTVPKLKQELTNAGFAAELLHIRNPTKKDILILYETLILQK